MSNVNDTTNGPSNAASDASLYPTQQLSCLTKTCVGYKAPARNQLMFWGDKGIPAGIRCGHCQTTWDEPGALYQQRDGWNTPLKGLAVTALSGIAVWFIPASLLPWPASWKIGVSIACAMASISAIAQLLQRNKRLQSLQLFAYLGEPANLNVPLEVTKQLQTTLEGKRASLDGTLKQQLLVLARQLQHSIMPGVVSAQHVSNILTLTSLESIRAQVKQGTFTPEEKTWLQQRIQTFAHVHEHQQQWTSDIRLAYDLLDTMVHELEDLKMGGHDEKEVARQNLQTAIEEGAELQERITSSPLHLLDVSS